MNRITQFGQSVCAYGSMAAQWCKTHKPASFAGSVVFLSSSLAVACRSTDPKVIAACVKNWSTTKAFPFVKETLIPASRHFVSSIARSLYTNGAVTRVGSGCVGAVITIATLVALESLYPRPAIVKAQTPPDMPVSAPQPDPQIAALITRAEQAEQANEALTAQLRTLNTQLEQHKKELADRNPNAASKELPDGRSTLEKGLSDKQVTSQNVTLTLTEELRALLNSTSDTAVTNMLMGAIVRGCNTEDNDEYRNFVKQTLIHERNTGCAYALTQMLPRVGFKDEICQEFVNFIHAKRLSPKTTT